MQIHRLETGIKHNNGQMGVQTAAEFIRPRSIPFLYVLLYDRTLRTNSTLTVCISVRFRTVNFSHPVAGCAAVPVHKQDLLSYNS